MEVGELTATFASPERERLEREVVEAAKRRRRAHEALEASIDQGMPIPICHEYDAANEHYEATLTALIEFESNQIKK